MREEEGVREEVECCGKKEEVIRDLGGKMRLRGQQKNRC